MSGCVNCVWELYREDFEYWQVKRAEAMKALVKENRFDLWPEDFGRKPGTITGAAGDMNSVDEDDPWKGVDVGIKVFVQTEKKLRTKKAARAAAAAAAVPAPPARVVSASL